MPKQKTGFELFFADVKKAGRLTKTDKRVEMILNL